MSVFATALLVCASSLAPEAPAAAQDAPAAPPASDPAAIEIANKVQTFYDQTKTFSADFKQEYLIKIHPDTPKKTQGHVVFEKPGRMSWKYDQPNGNRVVSDGKVLKVYEQENQQMFEQPVDKSQYPAALSFLLGQGSITGSFTLRKLDASAMKFENGWVLEGVPKDPTPAYQKVLLYIDGATSQVRRVLILDAQGNRNRFEFINPVVNTPVTPGEFLFQPPDGTQIVKP
jgi:outer membrane lipoprotein carrier protein